METHSTSKAALDLKPGTFVHNKAKKHARSQSEKKLSNENGTESYLSDSINESRQRLPSTLWPSIESLLTVSLMNETSGVMRVKEMITNNRSPCLLIKYYLSASKEMYREHEYSCWSVKG